jgi:SAM-dependent methyltransferase
VRLLETFAIDMESGNNGHCEGTDGRLDAPAFHRNHQPIWAVLSGFLAGKAGDVLEVGSGTGQHVVTFARRAPDITWWPSDIDAAYLQSIAAWRAHAELANVRLPRRIDVADPAWALDPTLELPSEVLAIFSANMIHIAPWEVARGLFAGAARLLRPDGRLFLYGPFKRDGRHTAESNAAFDASLRQRNAEWGVRDMNDVSNAADGAGLKLVETSAMPANNFILVFARQVDGRAT